jgi:hypothetical protein
MNYTFDGSLPGVARRDLGGGLVTERADDPTR